MSSNSPKNKIVQNLLCISRILNGLSNDVDEDLLLEDFHTLVNRFHVPVEEAKYSIIKKYGVRRLADLRAREQEVSVIVRVSSVKTWQASINGRQAIVSYRMLTDE